MDPANVTNPVNAESTKTVEQRLEILEKLHYKLNNAVFRHQTRLYLLDSSDNNVITRLQKLETGENSRMTRVHQLNGVASSAVKPDVSPMSTPTNTPRDSHAASLNTAGVVHPSGGASAIRYSTGSGSPTTGHVVPPAVSPGGRFHPGRFLRK